MKLIIAIALVCSAVTTEAALVNRTTYNAGTNALASQIAAKQGIIWTNSAGIVTPAGGQEATNRWQFTSGAASNDTNQAVIVNTAVEWTGGLLSDFKTGGASVAKLGVFGGLVLGRGSEVWANPATYTTPRIDVVAALDQGVTQSEIVLTATDDPGNNYWEIKLRTATNSASMFISDINKNLFVLDPANVSASTSILMADSRVTHTSGPLVDFKNNGTNQVSITFDGRIVTQHGAAITPSAANATGTAGTILWDASFIYICVAANTWKRVAIATW
jgi:hypothetical protein